MKRRSFESGFIATIAVIALALATLFAIHTTAVSIAEYVDSVDRREWRFQARLNAESCLDAAALMAAKDHFLEGKASIPWFGCSAEISRDRMRMTVNVRARATFSGVTSDDMQKEYSLP